MESTSLIDSADRSATSAQSQTWRRWWVGAALIALLATVAYWPSIRGGFLFDDDVLLTENALIKSPLGFLHCWYTTHQPDYVPLTSSTLWIEWRLWGMNPLGYRVTNLLLHIGACLLIWKLLRMLNVPGALLAALLFAVHPVNVESVAWVEQRKDTLSILLFLLSLIWYLKDDRSQTVHDALAPPPSRKWYWLSLLAFALAMFSKGSVVILPLILLLLAWWEYGSLTSRDLKRAAPFFLVSAILTPAIIWFVMHGSAERVRDVTFAQRAAGAGGVIWFYLSKALLPIRLAFVYPQWRIDAGNLLWWLSWLGMGLLTAALFCNRRYPWARAAFFAWAFYCICLLPALGFTDAGYMRFSLVADHYQHLALVAVVALAAAGWTVWRRNVQLSIPSCAVAAVAVGALTLLTWQQSRLYADPIDLYAAATKYNPDSYMLHNNLGVELAKKDRPQDAIEQYQFALQLNHDYALAHDNLAETLLHIDRPQEAIVHYQEALRLEPTMAAAHHNLANALRKTGRVPEAIEHYKQALELQPSFADAHFNYALVLADLKRLDESIEQFQDGLQFDPENAQAHFALGNVFRSAGRTQEAVEEYQQALNLQPDYPEVETNLLALRSGDTEPGQSSQNAEQASAAPGSAAAIYNLAVAQLNANKPQQAKENFQRVLEVNPDNADAHKGLGAALIMLGQPAKALEHFQQVVKLKPDDAEAQNNLATALANLGKMSEAAEHFQKAVQLKPAYLEAWTNLLLAYDQLHRTDDAIATARKLLDLSKSQNQTALAKRIEQWLSAHQSAPPSKK